MKRNEVMDKRMMILLGIVIVAIFAYIFFLGDKPLIMQVIDAIP